MSIEALNWALDHIQNPTMPSTTRFVLLILSNRADPEGECIPSLRYIMARTGLAKRTVISACQNIVDLGLMKVTPRRRENGSRTSNQYNLCITLCATSPQGAPGAPPPVQQDNHPRAPGAPPETKEETVPPSNEGGAPERAKGRTRKHPIPDGFAVSPRVRDWALGKQIMPSYIDECLEAFVSHAKAEGKLHVDWDEALMTWVRREMKFNRSPSKITPTLDRRCYFVETDTRCEDEGDIALGNGQMVCTKHYYPHLERVTNAKETT